MSFTSIKRENEQEEKYITNGKLKPQYINISLKVNVKTSAEKQRPEKWINEHSLISCCLHKLPSNMIQGG